MIDTTQTDEVRSGYAFLLVEQVDLLREYREIQALPSTLRLVRAKLVSYAQHYATEAGLPVVTKTTLPEVIRHAQAYLDDNQSLVDKALTSTEEG